MNVDWCSLNAVIIFASLLQVTNDTLHLMRELMCAIGARARALWRLCHDNVTESVRMGLVRCVQCSLFTYVNWLPNLRIFIDWPDVLNIVVIETAKINKLIDLQINQPFIISNNKII